MLRLPPAQRGTLDDLDAVFVEGFSGKVPLKSIATIDRKWVNGKIHRNQRERCFSIGAEPEDGLLFSQVLRAIQPQLDEISRELPPGYRIEQGGTKEEADKGLRMNIGTLSTSRPLLGEHSGPHPQRRGRNHMAEVSISKSSLAQQRNQFRLFQRFLPSLDLKRRIPTADVYPACALAGAARAGRAA